MLILSYTARRNYAKEYGISYDDVFANVPLSELAEYAGDAGQRLYPCPYCGRTLRFFLDFGVCPTCGANIDCLTHGIYGQDYFDCLAHGMMRDFLLRVGYIERFSGGFTPAPCMRCGYSNDPPLEWEGHALCYACIVAGFPAPFYPTWPVSLADAGTCVTCHEVLDQGLLVLHDELWCKPCYVKAFRQSWVYPTGIEAAAAEVIDEDLHL